MKKIPFLLPPMIVIVVLLGSACGNMPASATQAVQPTAVIIPTLAPAEVVPAAEAVQPEAAVQIYAPACQAMVSCEAPELKDTEALNTYCVEKIPYQNISVMPGTKFESLDTSGELKCRDSGTVVDGKNVITRTGKQLWTYELKFSNSACAAPVLTTGASQCQDGLGYDAAQNCCAPLAAADAGSITIKVNIGACP